MDPSLFHRTAWNSQMAAGGRPVSYKLGPRARRELEDKLAESRRQGHHAHLVPD